MEDNKQILKLKLEKNIENLSKTELIVHDYVINNPEQVIYSSILQLSNLVNVGEASIMRYCKKIGFNSFTNFKMELFKMLDEAQETANLAYIEQVTENMIKTINVTKKRLSEEDIDRASEMILNHKRLLIIGQGSSNITAQDAFSRFIRIGIDTSIVLDSHLLYMYSSLLNKDTVVLCYTFSGETYEVIKTAKIAKENGCPIIGVTNYASSEMTKIADLCLFTSGYEKNIKGGFLSSKVSQLFVSDILITRCAIGNAEKTKDYIERTTKSIIN